MMEDRYHATAKNRFCPDMFSVNKNITVEAKLTSSPTYVCTVHCFMNSTVAICLPGKALTKSKEVFILEDINRRAE
jgi:hypothetical protein